MGSDQETRGREESSGMGDGGMEKKGNSDGLEINGEDKVDKST